MQRILTFGMSLILLFFLHEGLVYASLRVADGIFLSYLFTLLDIQSLDNRFLLFLLILLLFLITEPVTESVLRHQIIGPLRM